MIAPGVNLPPPIGSLLMSMGFVADAECGRFATRRWICRSSRRCRRACRAFRHRRPLRCQCLQIHLEEFFVAEHRRVGIIANRLPAVRAKPRIIRYVSPTGCAEHGGAILPSYSVHARERRVSSTNPFHLHRRTVRQHFRHSLHYFVRVVAHRENRIRSVLSCMFKQQFIRLAARLLA